MPVSATASVAASRRSVLNQSALVCWPLTVCGSGVAAWATAMRAHGARGMHKVGKLGDDLTKQHNLGVLFSKVVTRFTHLVHTPCPHVLNPAVAHAATPLSQTVSGNQQRCGCSQSLPTATTLTIADTGILTPCRRAQLVDELIEREVGREQIAEAATAVFVFRVVHHQFLRWSIHPHHHLLSR